jgi:hypothetical protein
MEQVPPRHSHHLHNRCVDAACAETIGPTRAGGVPSGGQPQDDHVGPCAHYHQTAG